MRWSGWLSHSPCVMCWWMAKAISDRLTAIRRRHTGIRKRGCRASRTRCWTTSTRRRSISRPNFDDSTQEPEVLPARVPNMLINGSSGIAVGMATNIPPHNLTEIVSATIAMVQNPNLGSGRGAEDCSRSRLPDRRIPPRAELASSTTTTAGRGSLKLRAKVATEDIGRDREALIVTELPYQVNKARLIADIAAMANEKRIEGISDIRDESDRDGMRIVIELKRGENAEVVLNNLYKHTQMQINFGVIMLSIVNGQPRELGMLDCLKRFIDHRIDVVRRRTDFLLRKAREREHLLLGFQKALDHLDLVIELIRAARTPKEARAGLTGDAEALAALLPTVTGRLRLSSSTPDRGHLRLQRTSGASHHRTAASAPHRHGAAENPRRTRRDSAHDRRVPGNSGLGDEAPRRDHRRTERSSEDLRR